MDRRAFLLLTLAGCADPQLEPTLTQAVGSGSPPPAPAAPAPVPVVSGDPGFDAWLAQFKPKAVLAGVPQAVVDRETAGLTPDTGVVASDGRQPEFSKPVGDYVKGTVSDVRISQGRQFRDTLPYLPGIEQAFRVPREIVLAVWAMESAFGKVQGDKDIVRCLATLAADGRRRGWAESELISALKIIATGEQTRARLKGSWAGAMGQTQFLPGVYLSTAIDGDRDGHRDIWGSTHDALASTANYLAKAGWKPGESWSREVRLPTDFDYSLTEGAREPLAVWTNRGVRRADGLAWSAADQASSAGLILPSGYQGPAFLIFPNHAAIMKYNNSTAYALGVGLLALRFGGDGPLVTPWPAETPLSRTDRVLAQESLVKLGYDTGGVDGAIGPKTRVAIRAWQQANRIPADGYLTPQMIQSMAMQAAGMASRPQS
ncbi:MAG: lytic murein transglycosylase [Caulobacteraceae bacterium]|nr:MAG: lytic murein transglycosylase [Caulobacteraceae bacterium]